MSQPILMATTALDVCAVALRRHRTLRWLRWS